MFIRPTVETTLGLRRLHQPYRETQVAAHDRDHNRAAELTYDAEQIVDALRAAQPVTSSKRVRSWNKHLTGSEPI